MQARLSRDNPFDFSRYGFAWQQISPGSRAHLDFGCYEGRFIGSLIPKGIARLAGVDVSSSAIEKARQRFPAVEFHWIQAGRPLPFPDGTFTSITLMDVMEHVYEQRELLRELRRVLADDGILIITLPGQHVFSFLDMGNMKFRFPRLHRWVYCLRHTREEYEYRYVSNPDGLIGDVSAKKKWHEHFSRRALSNLLAQERFEVALFDGAGFFYRPLSLLSKPFLRFPRARRAWEWLIQKDSAAFSSANLFCLARKLRE